MKISSAGKATCIVLVSVTLLATWIVLVSVTLLAFWGQPYDFGPADAYGDVHDTMHEAAWPHVRDDSDSEISDVSAVVQLSRHTRSGALHSSPGSSSASAPSSFQKRHRNAAGPAVGQSVGDNVGQVPKPLLLQALGSRAHASSPMYRQRDAHQIAGPKSPGRQGEIEELKLPKFQSVAEEANFVFAQEAAEHRDGEALLKELNETIAERQNISYEYVKEKSEVNRLSNALSKLNAAEDRKAKRRLWLTMSLGASAAILLCTVFSCLHHQSRNDPAEVGASEIEYQAWQPHPQHMYGRMFGLEFDDCLRKKERRLERYFPWCSSWLGWCFCPLFAVWSCCHGCFVFWDTFSARGIIAIITFLMVWTAGVVVMWHNGIIEPLLQQLVVFAYIALAVGGALAIVILEAFDNVNGLIGEGQHMVHNVSKRVDHALHFFGGKSTQSRDALRTA